MISMTPLTRRLIQLGLMLAATAALADTDATAPANVIVIVSDDQGWGDVGFNGQTDIPTPNLDALAADGVVFSQGYAAHPYCSPSRAGLLSGRYQQRFGHENNIPYKSAGEQDGLPLTERLLSEVLHEHHYRTAAIGKWHLGDARHFWPNQRGFDDWFGFYGGGLSYWGDTEDKPDDAGVRRNGAAVPIDQLSYLTDDFSTETVNLIHQYANDKQRFFLYLAYNAPHSPMHATKKYLDRVSHIEEGERATYAAMVVGMDEGIGRVVKALKETGLYDNTLIFFLSDNGGTTTRASNRPFRGHKGMLFEGGIRVPFLLSWPQGLKGGRRYDDMVSALDIFPTVLAATQTAKPDKKLDGVNLLPYLRGQKTGGAHQTLFWRYSDGAGWAVRHENYKLIYSAYKQRHLLFDLGKDPFERTDLIDSLPDVASKLSKLYQHWSRGTVPALWQDPHIANVHKEEALRQNALDKASAGENKKREKVQEKL